MQTNIEAFLDNIAILPCQAQSKAAESQQVQEGDKLQCHLQEQSRIQKQRMLRSWQQACMRPGRPAAGRTGQPPRSGNAGMPTVRSLCASLATCRATCQVIPDSPPSPQFGVNSQERLLSSMQPPACTKNAGQGLIGRLLGGWHLWDGTAGSGLC